MADTPPQAGSAGSFEASLKELERIVASLEKGNIPLEEQLKHFEAGVALSRECLKKLEEVERRVEKLVCQPDGSLSMAQLDSLPSDGV